MAFCCLASMVSRVLAGQARAWLANISFSTPTSVPAPSSSAQSTRGASCVAWASLTRTDGKVQRAAQASRACFLCLYALGRLSNKTRLLVGSHCPTRENHYCCCRRRHSRSLGPQLITTSKPRSGRKRIRASDAHSFSMRLLLAILLSHAAGEQSMNRCVDSDTWHKRGDPQKNCLHRCRQVRATRSRRRRREICSIWPR